MPLPPNTRVVVHSKTHCPSCTGAKAWLNERNVPFEEIRHETQAERDALYDSLKLKGHKRTVPQIMIIDDKLGGISTPVGGFEDLKISGLV